LILSKNPLLTPPPLRGGGWGEGANFFIFLGLFYPEIEAPYSIPSPPMGERVRVRGKYLYPAPIKLYHPVSDSLDPFQKSASNSPSLEGRGLGGGWQLL
jgi:hypothetical protein